VERLDQPIQKYVSLWFEYLKLEENRSRSFLFTSLQ